MNNKNEKQNLIIEYLISSPDTFAVCNSILKPEYFDPEFRKTVNFIRDYYSKYHATPNPSQILAETGVALKLQQPTKDQTAYFSNEIEKFCQLRAFQQALVAAPAKMDEANFESVLQSMKDAISVSLTKDLGIDYFLDPHARLEKLALEPSRTPTKWHMFDTLINGGLARTEMILFSANSGRGKSITLANLAVNILAQKLNVLYLTLELSESMVSQRFDSMFTGISSVVWRQHTDDMAASLEIMAPHMGNLVIKHMPAGTTANTIRSYLKEFELIHHYIPDLLIIDYLDIMGPNERADNISEKDKQTSEQLREIGFDYNMFIATASQQNRSAIEASSLNQSHIAGGLTKVNTVDIYVSINMTDSMKAAGEISFQFLKTRSSDGVGKTAYLRWDSTSLRIMNHMKDEDIDEDGVIKDRIATLTSPQQNKKSLIDLIEM